MTSFGKIIGLSIFAGGLLGMLLGRNRAA